MSLPTAFPLAFSWRSARAVAALAGPLILTQLAQVAVSTTNIVMMGLLGAKEVAAGGLAAILFNQLRTMGVGVVTATGNLVASANGALQTNPNGSRQTNGALQAKANGSGNPTEIRDLVRASFASATLIGLAFALLMAAGGGLLRYAGQDESVVTLAAGYLQAAAPGMLPCLWFQSLRNYTVGLKRPGPLLAITILSVGLNLLGNYALMFGHFGLPALGLTGIALSSSVVYLASFLCFLVVVRRDPILREHLSLAAWRSSSVALVRTWKLGLPIAATYGSEAAFFTVLTLIIGTLGANALAAQAIANQVIYIVFMISVGLSHASSISISQATAQGDYAEARRLGHSGLALGLAAMAVVALLYLVAPGWVIAPFLDARAATNAEAVRLATSLLAIAALLQFFDCSQNIGVGLLRGLGDTKRPFGLSLIGYWLIGLPCAYGFGVLLGYGLNGIWLGLLIGLASTAALLLRGFSQQLRRLELAA
ncbi:MATE family efflux transporter [Andreprevotia chitinilytica]|uniref:MATE family efflux transporter n=1 Tax=Andreprevotia chitinilytica TaxID=396808 RepID=UPI000556CD07|nr:MATE family efflux transporter [Andreprevotia chitinilytica]